MLPFLLIAALMAFAPAAHAADTEQSHKQITLQFEVACSKLKEQNKKTVLEFYDAAINQKISTPRQNFSARAIPSTIRAPPTDRKD